MGTFDARTVAQIDRLVAELKTIERWNATYWRRASKGVGVNEMIGFQSSRDRRRAILDQLVALLPKLDTQGERRPSLGKAKSARCGSSL
jgi:hypothetical protein